MTRPIRKAVFPVAGLGTRFLPATKAMPKELLPVVDKPVLQYAVEEAKAAGIEEFIFVSSRGKGMMEDHFDSHPELQAALERKNKAEALEALHASTLESGQLTIVRQARPLGLGHAVWCARHAIGDEPFAVLLPDEVVLDRSCIAELVEAHAKIGKGHVLAVQDVPREKTSMYGILDPDGDTSGTVFKAKGMVEKPDPQEAPSTFAATGRYVLEPSVFEYLERGVEGAGGEIQLTDAIAGTLDDAPLYGCAFTGTRYDCGDKLGFLKANIAAGLAREGIGDDLRDFLREIVTG
jgi:UTP--glucose-1-phosphate uridylyltransferase